MDTVEMWKIAAEKYAVKVKFVESHDENVTLLAEAIQLGSSKPSCYAETKELKDLSQSGYLQIDDFSRATIIATFEMIAGARQKKAIRAGIVSLLSRLDGSSPLPIFCLERVLKEVPGHLLVVNEDGEYPDGFCSYRGSYEEASLEFGSTPLTVAEFREMCSDMHGEYSGWKGGEYYINQDSPCWLEAEGVPGSDGLHDIRVEEDRIILLKREF